MRRVVLWLALVVTGARPVGAQSTASDLFDYNSGANIVGQSGGSGWSGAWSSGGGGGWRAEQGLFYCTNLYCLSAAGYGANANFGSINPNTSGIVRRDLTTALGGSGQVAWFSFLSSFGGDRQNTWSGFELQGPGPSDFLFVGKPYNQDFWGICASTVVSQTLQSSTKLAGETQFVVVRIDFKPGNDDVHVWLQPDFDAQPSNANADIEALNYHDYDGANAVAITAGVDSPLQGITVGFDEIRFGTTWAEVSPHYKRPDDCELTSHGLKLRARTGATLQDFTLHEKWRDKAKVRSRTCKAEQTNAGGSWQSIPGGVSVTSHAANATAPSSSAHAESGVRVLTHSPKLLEAETYTTSSRTATTTGCSSNRRKHAGKAVTVCTAKLKATGNNEVTTGGWNGFWNNCRASIRKRDRLLADPVDVSVQDVNSGIVTRYRVIEILSHVWDGETRWTVIPAAHDLASSIAFPSDTSAYQRVLINTATRMRLSIRVGSAIVPTSQHGTLDVETRGGAIVSSSATGVFSPLASLLVVGQSSTFTIPLPEIQFTLDIPGTPEASVVTIEGGGGATDEELPETSILTGCNLVTGIGDGAHDSETSSPQGSDQTMGFGSAGGYGRITQTFTVPGATPVALGAIRIVAYQEGMPTSVPPTPQAVTVAIYDGPPWQSGSHLLHQSTTSGSDLEAEWLDVNRTTTAALGDTTRALMELWWGCMDCPGVVLQPGTKWMTVEVTGDPAYGAVGLPPCPFADPTDNAWGQAAVGGAWSPLQDAGSLRPVSFPIDVFSEAMTSGPGGPHIVPSLTPSGVALLLLVLLVAGSSSLRRHEEGLRRVV